MKKQVIKEIRDIKYLFNYNRGRILSEQPEVDESELNQIEDMDIFTDEIGTEIDEEYSEQDMDDYSDELPSFYSEGEFKGMTKPNGDMNEEMDLPVMLPGTKEKERTITTPGIKPGSKPKTPYSPKPGPKKNPKAGEKDIPTWLTFDELGITFE